MIVTLRHAYTIPGYNTRPGFCRGGLRTWFDAHGLDFRAFKRDGIEADVLTATGDGLALALVDWARQCEAKEASHGQ